MLSVMFSLFIVHAVLWYSVDLWGKNGIFQTCFKIHCMQHLAKEGGFSIVC